MKRVISGLRSVFSVLTGYIILAFGSMLFVIAVYVYPVFEMPNYLKLILAAPFTIFTSAVAGIVVAKLAPHRGLSHALVVAGLMTLVTIISLVLDVAVEPTSYKLIYLVCMNAGVIAGAKRVGRAGEQVA